MRTRKGVTGAGPRPMRYNPVTATPRLRAAAARHAPKSPKEGNTMADNTPATSEATDDLGDLNADDWSTAAEAMAQEAKEADGGATDGNRTDESEPAGRDGRYRRSLKAAERTNERLSRALEAMQTAEVQRIAADRLADPSDLFINAKLADMLDTDDRVDPDRVNAAVDNLLVAKPHWEAARPHYAGELRSGASEPPMAQSGPSWRDAFAPQPEET